MTDELENKDKHPDIQTYQKQVDDLTANNAAMAEELAQMKKRQTVGSTYSRLLRKAELLVSQYKMTPAQFKATFTGDTEGDIDNFCNPPEGEDQKYNLSNIEYHLSQLEQFGQSIAPVAGSDGKPQEIADPAQDQYDAELKAYRNKRGYTQKEAS